MKQSKKIIFKYRLYGRSRGRNKNNIEKSDVSNIKINKIDSSKYNVVDIGPGYGESTIEIAKTNNRKIVIACEKYIDGINNLIKEIGRNSLKNVFIFDGNANQFLDEYCTTQSISELWILFPDPWPKKRHFKRRLINDSFFNKIKKLLKKDGSIHIATDSKNYLSQILMNIYNVKNDFLWANQERNQWYYSNLSLPKTKYFKKAMKSGLNPFYIKMIKL